MKTISKLALVCSLVLGSAAAQATANRHGAVYASGPSAKAVVAGPISIHAYAPFAGGAVYVVPAVSGTDGDCRLGAAARTHLPADRIVEVSVAAGQVACVETAAAGSFELLWHATADAVKPVAVAQAQAQARSAR